MYAKILSFGKRNLIDLDTYDIGLSNSMACPMTLRCVFNKVFLVNHWRDILNSSCKWLTVIGAKP